MESSPPSKSSHVDEAANKKKYAILFGYCGTGYHGSQTFRVIFNFIYVEIRALIRLMMTSLTVYTRQVVFPILTSLMKISSLRFGIN